MRRILNFTLLALMLIIASCNKKTVGNITIEALPETSEITIDNFPQPKIGIAGFNTVSYPSDFSFEKTDEAVYELIKSASFTKTMIAIKLRQDYKDQYGKDSLANWIEIGVLDREEAKKYADFSTWNRKYGVYSMLKFYNSTGKKPDDGIQTSTTSITSYQSQTSRKIELAEKNGSKIINIEDFRPREEIDENNGADTLEINGKVISYLRGNPYDVIVIKEEDGNVRNVFFHALGYKDIGLDNDNALGKFLLGYGYTSYEKDGKLGKTYLIKGKVVLD